MKVNPAAIQARERHAKWLELRREGWSYERIAQHFDCARSSVWEAVRSRLRDVTAEPARELVTLEAERLDELWCVAFAQAKAGDLGAIGTCLRIQERRAALLRLESAEQDQGGETMDVDAEQLAEVLRAHGYEVKRGATADGDEGTQDESTNEGRGGGED